MSAFLFDLDQTLLDTRHIEVWRRFKMWTLVEENLHLARPFTATGLAPHLLPAAMRARGHRVGVVTTSPRWYAEKLVRQFGIEHDVLVAYDDTEKHKPDPEPILEALRKLGVEPSDACHVGDAIADQEACFHAGVDSVGAMWGVQNFEEFSAAAPTLLLAQPETLLEVGAYSPRLYVGETLAAGHQPKMHGGSVLPCGGDPPRYALGRYFKTEDPRHAGDAYSAQVLKLKTDDTPAPMFAQALAAWLDQCEWKPTCIVPVPPKPSQSRNRFEAVLTRLEPLLGDETGVQIDGLKCVKEIEGYKAMNPTQRAAAMPGTFESKYVWEDERVLLLDDVLTTGETVRECARVLLADGAREVRIVALGRHQRSFVREICPNCERPLRVRTNGATGEQFWGCSGFRRNDPNACRYTRPM